MGAFVKVAHVRDVPPGKMLTVTVDGQPVVLANVNGAIYAFSGICSHGGRDEPESKQPYEKTARGFESRYDQP